MFGLRPVYLLYFYFEEMHITYMSPSQLQQFILLLFIPERI